MSDFVQPATCPLCERETLVFRFGRMRCTDANCDFCQYCEGPCQSGTASGCAGAEGERGESPRWSVPSLLLDKTFCIEYSPNCFKRWLVRLPGKGGVIDKRQYNRKEGMTGDCLGFGHSLEEAALAAVEAQKLVRS